jgi:arylsulfatase A-like enzyme
LPNRALRIDADVQIAPLSVVVFLVDGLAPARLEELANAGLVPNIERRFIAGGTTVRRAISSLPSTTYANVTSLLTGYYPAHHGIVSNTWFDRDSGVVRDSDSLHSFRLSNRDLIRPTVFQLLRAELTAAIHLHTRRGADLIVDDDITGGLRWLFKDWLGFDALCPRAFASDVVRYANRKNRWPTLIVCYMPGVDTVAHRSGFSSRRYDEAVANADAQIGRIMDAYDQAGLSEHTRFVLVSDHGQTSHGREHVLNVAGWLRRQCHRRVCTIRSDHDRHKVRHVNAMVSVTADRCCTISLRGETGWRSRPTPEMVMRILDTPLADGMRLHEHPAVELVASRRSDGSVQLRSRGGTARVERRETASGEQFRLMNEEGDALGYMPDPRLARFVDAGWHTSREWFAMTADSDIPDIVPQAPILFESSRGGDVYVFASRSGTFGRKHNSGHGSCIEGDVHATMMFAGAGVPAGRTIDRARLVDVTPTILEWLGHESAAVPEMHGVSISDEVLSPSEATP